MGQFTVVKNGESRSYKDGNKFVAADKVSDAAKKALEEGQPGLVVDDSGERVDTSTETDESEDEDLSNGTPTNTNPNAGSDEADDDDADDGDDSDEGDDDAADDGAAKARTRRTPADRKSPEQKAAEAQAANGVPVDNSPVPQDEAGFGFPRSKGKTLSIFSNKPHETVKHVAGVTVPLTHDEYATKTDAEIIAKLRDLGPKKVPQPQL